MKSIRKGADDVMKCPHCGADSSGKFCEYCGSEMPYNGPQVQNTYTTENVTQHVTNVYYVNSSDPAAQPIPVDFPPAVPYTPDPQSSFPAAPVISKPLVSDKNKNITVLLCFFLGISGVHLFYVGRWKKGLLYLFTAGLFGIGWLIDLFTIGVNKFKDAKDLPVTGNAKKAWLIVFIFMFLYFAAVIYNNSYY